MLHCTIIFNCIIFGCTNSSQVLYEWTFSRSQYVQWQDPISPPHRGMKTQDHIRLSLILVPIQSFSCLLSPSAKPGGSDSTLCANTHTTTTNPPGHPSINCPFQSNKRCRLLKQNSNTEWDQNNACKHLPAKATLVHDKVTDHGTSHYNYSVVMYTGQEHSAN